MKPRFISCSCGAAVVAGGFVAAFYGLGLAPLRPYEGWPWLALLAAAVGGLPLPRVLQFVVWPAAAAFTAFRVVPISYFQFWIIAFGGVLLLGFATMSERRPVLLIWIACIVGGAGLLFWSGNALFAEMAASLAAALLSGLFSRGGPVATGAMGVAAVLHPALLAAGAFNNFSDVPTWAFALLGLAPLAALPFRRAGMRE